MYPYISRVEEKDFLDLIAPVDYREQQLELANIERAIKGMSEEDQKLYSFLLKEGE